MKTYYIPTGDWPISTGYAYAHTLLRHFGLHSSSESDADLLVLLGGADIGKNVIRDETELLCVRQAKECGKSIFGICRGMQFLLHTSGVSLIEHIPDCVDTIEHATLTAHWTGQSSWHTTSLGLLVNSRHHQGAIDAPGWEILDTCSDGIIEAVSREAEFGVQWHPEHPEMKSTLAIDWLSAELKKRNMI